MADPNDAESRATLPARLQIVDVDADLIAAAREDRAAFAPLYRRYVDPVYRYCLRRLGSKEAAEDATALIFEKVLAALPKYRDAAPLPFAPGSSPSPTMCWSIRSGRAVRSMSWTTRRWA